MTDARALVERIRIVLRELSLLSESPAMRVDGDRVSGGGSKSKPPAGVRFGKRDLRDLSLAEYWHDRFRKARGDMETQRFFLYLAERDLAKVKRRQEPRDPHESADTREARVVELYEGLDALEAAVVEDCTEVWLRKVRIRHHRDPVTGWPVR